MSFTNDDSLNSHNRKHDIDLHLGIDNSTTTTEADQTPTPTRFIRNCEEVGLFQDLQNVNPFDETFRKATELAKTGSLHVPEASSDDSLHTPHIFPHIEEFTNDNKNREFNATASINDAILKIDDKKCKNNLNSTDLNIEHSRSNIISITSTTPPINTNEGVIKFKLKEALQSRNKPEENGIDTIENVTPKNLCQLSSLNSTDKDLSQTTLNRRINKTKDKNKHLKQSHLEQKREINRVAQVRSRERKKVQFQEIVNEVTLLRSEIKQLSKENQELKDEVDWLKTVLLYHKDCPVSKDPRIAEEINLLRKSAQKEKEAKTPPVKKNIPIRPTPSAFIALAPVAPQLLLQLPNQNNSSLLAALTPLLPKSQLVTTQFAPKVANPSEASYSNINNVNVIKVEKRKRNKPKEKVSNIKIEVIKDEYFK